MDAQMTSYLYFKDTGEIVMLTDVLTCQPTACILVYLLHTKVYWRVNLFQVYVQLDYNCP